MTEETGISAGSEAAFELPADAPEEFSSVNDALSYLTSLDEKRKNPPAESAKEATAEHESSGEDGAAAVEEQPTGETEEIDPAAKPPLDLPRSWTKDRAEVWNRLDPAAQEILLDQDRKASAEVRRVQNEAAAERNAAKAEREAAEKAKQQYEAQLPSLMRELENVSQSSFHDIKTMDDVVRLQAEDPFRFQAWQVHQMRLQAAKAESDRVQNETAQSKQTKRATYEAEQNKLLAELVPEVADPKKLNELRDRAVKMLTDPDDIGLKNDQLTRWMADDTGHEILSNAGIQKLIADGLKYRDIISAPKAIAAKPLPQVVRPGTSRPAGSDASEREQTLTRKPELTLKEANELYDLQSRRQRRA